MPTARGFCPDYVFGLSRRAQPLSCPVSDPVQVNRVAVMRFEGEPREPAPPGRRYSMASR